MVATFVPAIPAGFIILGMAVIHEAVLGWTEVSKGLWIAIGVLTIMSSLVDNIAGALGAKKYGGTRHGIWGAFLGGIAGMFVFPPWGLFLMPFVGAFAGELLAGRNERDATRGAWGTFVGLLGGILGKAMIHFVMGVLIIRAIF